MKKIGCVAGMLIWSAMLLVCAQDEKPKKEESPVDVPEADRKKLGDEQWKKIEESVRRARRAVVRLDLKSGTGSGTVVKYKDGFYFISVAHNFGSGLIKKIEMPGSSPNLEEFHYKISKLAMGSAGSQKEDYAVFKVEDPRDTIAYAEVNEKPELSNGDPVLVLSYPMGRGQKGKEGYPIQDIGFVTATGGMISVKSVYVSHKPGVPDGAKVTVGPGSSGGGLFDRDGKLIGIIREVSGMQANGIVTCVPIANALKNIK